jgi:hypothetical protein
MQFHCWNHLEEAIADVKSTWAMFSGSIGKAPNSEERFVVVNETSVTIVTVEQRRLQYFKATSIGPPIVVSGETSTPIVVDALYLAGMSTPGRVTSTK